MGLFSFLKGSGAKIFDKKEEEKVKTASAADAERMKKDAMMRAVNELKLPVKNLSLDIQDDTVVVYGEAETQVAKELVILTVGTT